MTQPQRGALLMIAAVASFTVLDSTAKSLTQALPVAEVVWARYLFSLLLFPLMFPGFHLRTALHTDRPWLQIGRALLLVGGTASIFLAVHYLPLAETYAVSFVSPSLVALFAMVLLGERVSARRWVAIAVGFVGIVVIIQPGSGIFSWAVIFPLTMAVCWALYQVVTRLLSATEPPLTTLFFTMLVGAVATTPIVPIIWVTPAPRAWVLMVFMGLIGLIGQLLLIKAFAIAESSLLAPFAYTQIIWATLIGYVFFDDLPSVATIVGAAVVVASGLALMTASRRGA